MRLLIADDHALFRGSLRSLLETRGIEVVGEAGNGREALDLAQRLEPEVVLLDLSMPVMSGLEVIPLLSEQQPEAKIVVLTASTEDDDLFEALKAGAHGYLLKNLEADSFFELLDGVLEGQPALTPELSRKVLQAFAKGGQAQPERKDPDALTDREMEVLQLMVDGVTSNRQLSRRLNVSENTVKFHVRNILDKLHLHNRAQAVSYALRKKVVEPEG
ncbi:MAG TPA: response regulator transcription factor [Thermoanaerobaculia bacterium]|nr:response regulator transcription factor [Thermoanaerobaculia bacterium]